MNTALLSVIAAAMLVVAAYAQLRIPRFTATPAGVMLARGVLILVGVAFGLVSATYYTSPALSAPLVFLSGFGLAHVPAAIILMLKRGRGETPS